MHDSVPRSVYDCLVDFGSRILGDFHFRNKMCGILKINAATGHQWFDANIMPKGENLLKLRLILELNGYYLVEKTSISPGIWKLGNLIALGSVSLEEARHVLGFKNVQDVYNLCFGKQKTSPERMASLENFCRLFETDPESKKEYQKKLKQWQENSVFVKPGNKPVPESPTKTAPRLIERTAAIKSLAHLIRAAIPLAEYIVSDDFSIQERERLRELTKEGRSNGVFDLSNLLNRLCTETARKAIN